MNQQGFTIVQIVAVVASIVVLAGAGLVAYNVLNPAAPKESHVQGRSSSVHEKDHDMDTMSEVSSSADLDEAAQSLDDPSFDNDGLSELDAAAAKF